jgi:hypothetical protein
VADVVAALGAGPGPRAGRMTVNQPGRAGGPDNEVSLTTWPGQISDQEKRISAKTSANRDSAYIARSEAGKPKTLCITSAPWVRPGRISCR